MYAKFLKNLLTVKRRLNVKKNVFLAQNVSSVLLSDISLKYKDPGAPTISRIMGKNRIERALIDLGASVNILPCSIYKQLDLGALKPIIITLQLADRSVKMPRGIIKDVIIQIDTFYFPVEFVIWDEEPSILPSNHVPLILGRPFLATANALINNRSGRMQLTFGNMILETNIFKNIKNEGDKSEPRETVLIEESHEHKRTHKREPLGVGFIAPSENGDCDIKQEVGEMCLVTTIKSESEHICVSGKVRFEEIKRKDGEINHERELGDISLEDFEKEFGTMDENLNVEVQPLLDSFSHLEEREWQETIDLCDHPPIPLESSNAIEEKTQVLSELEPGPCTPKIKRNQDAPSKSVHVGKERVRDHEEFFPVSQPEIKDLSLIYGA